MSDWTLHLPDPEATRALGRALGATARRGDVLLLSGGLGAGKTSLAQGLAEGLGITEPVSSPTFTLLNEYRGRLPFYHLDLYRLEPAEIAAMGLAEYWEEPRGVVAIEWPERLPAAIAPEEPLALALRAPENGGREAVFTAIGAARRWLDEGRHLAARH